MRVSEEFILSCIERAGIHPSALRKTAQRLLHKQAGFWSDLSKSPILDPVNFSPVTQLNEKQVNNLMRKVNMGVATPEEAQVLRRYYKDQRAKMFAPDIKMEESAGMPDFIRKKYLNVPEVGTKPFRLLEKMRQNKYLNPSPSVDVYTTPYTGIDETGRKRVLPWETNSPKVTLTLNPDKGGY